MQEPTRCYSGPGAAFEPTRELPSTRFPRLHSSRVRSKFTFGIACWKRRATRSPSPRLAWKSSGARRQCSTRPTSRGTVFSSSIKRPG